MEYDKEKVDKMALALMYLTTWRETAAPDKVGRSWKGYDFSILDRLHEKGLIADPKSKAKSVILTKEAMEQSEKLFKEYFGK